MSKIKIYELAKELGVQSKEVIEYLGKKGMDVKSHMSSLEDTDASTVKKAFHKEGASSTTKLAPKPATVAAPAAPVTPVAPAAPAATQEPATEPKKKNLVHVFRPQNTQSAVNPARPQSQQSRPAQTNSTASAQDRPTQGDRPQQNRYQGDRPQGDRPQQNRYQGDRPQGDRPQQNRYQGDRPQGDRPQQNRYQGDRPQGDRPQQNRYQGDRPQGDRPQQNRYQGDRPQGDRPQQNRYQGGNQGGYQGGNQQGRSQGGYQGGSQGGYQGGNQQGRSQGGYQGGSQGGYQGGNQQGRSQGGYQGGSQGGYQGGNQQGRSQGGYQGGSQGGYQGGSQQGRSQGGYQGGNQQGRSQGGYQGGSQGGYQGGNQQGRSQGGYQGGNQGGNQQGRSYGDRDQARRPIGEKERKPAATVIEGQKPQRSKPKGKEDYKKKEYRQGDDRGAKGKKKIEPKQQLVKPPVRVQKQVPQIKLIVLPELLTIKELAEKMKVVPSVIVKKLFLQGKVVTVNQEIDYEAAEEIAMEFEILSEKEIVVDVIEELLKEDEEDEAQKKKRPAVVCVMGHVDHGKTSLLDAIRHTKVIDREAGGITQHIGAYVAEINSEKITFLDTPGHEAFTAMRMRGASSTDIAILVVAADDGVMPQTVEAINHAKAAGIEIVVAVNKIDKPSANLDRVKQELAEYELISEDWGGSTIFVPVSAKTGEGLETLMEMLLLSAEVLELKSNPDRKARGLVIEAELDKGKGSVATVLVQKGTLRVGDAIAAGSAYGKVRAMMDDKGRRVTEAGPSMPVEILGLNGVPNAGEVFVACENDKEARGFAETFISQGKVKLLADTKAKLSLDGLFTQIKAGNLKELGIVVKADVQGSVEAIKQSLTKLSNDEVVVKIIHGGVGAINESDVSLASASNAIIIGFNVRPDMTAKETADREGVDLRLYRVIYSAIEDVEAAMKGMLDPVFEEKILGHAEVRQIFKASGIGTIAGSYVLDGTFERDCSVRMTRDGVVVYDGPLASLKRFKDDVKEVRAGYECGFVFEKFNDVKEGDLVESFKMVEVPR